MFPLGSSNVHSEDSRLICLTGSSTEVKDCMLEVDEAAELRLTLSSPPVNKIEKYVYLGFFIFFEGCLVISIVYIKLQSFFNKDNILHNIATCKIEQKKYTSSICFKRIDNLKMVGKEPTCLTILLFLDFLIFIFQKPTYYFTGYSKFSSISYDEVDEIKKHQLSPLD